MKVTNVSLRETEAAAKAGRPALTPELLAASGARYSRNNEGLEAILSKIDPNNLDKSVDSIFRMIDYGHQSIADMVPVAMFIDDISILLAYLAWSWCPTAGGQESSTRYIKLERDGLVEPGLLGVPKEEHGEWYEFMNRCFDAYSASLEFWKELGDSRPALTKVPTELLNDSSPKALRKVARMKRNYAFDRARYFLPVAAKTNMMLIMSARGWMQLCQNLLSHWLPEANFLGDKIRGELNFNAPRMVKHAERKSSFADGRAAELREIFEMAKVQEIPTGEAPCLASIDLSLPVGVTENDLVRSLQWHDNRYAFVGSSACRTSARFSWTAVAIAEIRDLNRHRTGQKYCPLIPHGFYCAQDQVPNGLNFEDTLLALGDQSTRSARKSLAGESSGFAAWFLLGSQFKFEHTTTLDKYIYEAELRTGVGAHFRYADHLRESVRVLTDCYPKLTSAIRIGEAEPE